MLDEHFRKAGIRDKVQITYITPFTRIYSADSINEVIEPIYKARSIESIITTNPAMVITSLSCAIKPAGILIRYFELTPKFCGTLY